LLNQIRRDNPALQDLRSLRFHHSESPEIIAFSKRGGVNGTDIILCVCNTDPENEHSTIVHWNMHELGLPWGHDFAVTDQISGTTWRWNEHTFVKLDPAHEVAHIAKIISPIEPLTVFTESQSTPAKVKKQ
jgi:starch synthase (maltosyl-transferring)